MTSETQSQKLTLVVGSSGTTGRRVAERLAERGGPTRLGSRSGSPAFDWAGESTWRAALAGVAASSLVDYRDLVAPGAVDTVRRFAGVAVSSGARRLVLLSGR